MVDIEGLTFFDVEWDHAWLRMRFGEAYSALRPVRLDPNRLAFYRYAQVLSLIEGPLRIADTDFPNRRENDGMALIRCDFSSATLDLSTSMTVLLPEDRPAPAPVLYLLHGLTDDHTAWTRFTSIERYAAAKGLAVVMPQVHRSFYANEAYGMRFWDFLSAELPATVERLFRVSTRRADTYVAGLSMGGYGAMRWALRQPERFAAAASLSGALDLAHIEKFDLRPHMRQVMDHVFADRGVAGGDEDLLQLLRVADPGRLPRLMLRCGLQDHLVEQNERFVAACRAAGVELDAGFGPGEHDWAYWDAEIRTVLDWLPISPA